MSSTALKTLLEQAEAERDQAQAALRHAEEQAQRARQQAGQLLAYRGEYQQRWTGQFSRQGTMEIVHCYQSFALRLDEALAQQQRQADAADATTERLRQALLGAEMRVAAVKKLIERRQAEQRRADERRDQRQTDETAQQLRWLATNRAEPAQH
ncbi:MAG: flagellar export protein FliJ [Rubrivivax sp.]